jgi:hypothetical protein
MSVREWSKLKYLDPEKVLVGLRDIALTYPLNKFPQEVATLRSREMRPYGEGRQCALFCYFMGKALGIDVKVAMVERSDYDCVAYLDKNGKNNFIPIQMKEFVPENVNANASLQSLIESLSKYVDSESLVVAVHINRCGTIKMSELSFPPLNIGALWFFGANGSDQTIWTVIGNVLKPNARFYELRYPGT